MAGDDLAVETFGALEAYMSDDVKVTNRCNRAIANGASSKTHTRIVLMVWAAVIIIALSGEVRYEAYVPMFNSQEACQFFVEWQASLVEAVAPDAVFDAQCVSSA